MSIMVASGTSEEGTAEQVASHAARAAARTGCELVNVLYLPEGRSWLLRIVIDKDGGVSVEDCAAVSRQLSAILDVEDLVPHAYRLEVSSPGLDQELLVAKDYERYSGRLVRIQADSPVRERKVIRGVLRGLREGVVRVEDAAGETYDIPLRRIVDARLEVEI